MRGSAQGVNWDWFSENVRKLRKARGLSQQQLAYEAGISRATVADIERGARASRTEIRTLLCVSGALRVPAWVLLADDSGPKKEVA